MSDWYYIQKGMIRDETIGPIDTDTLAKRIRRGEITPDTIIFSPDKTNNALVKMSAFQKLVEIYVPGEQERTREAEKQREAKIEQRRLEKELAAKQKELARQERMREKMEKMKEQQTRMAAARPPSHTPPIPQFQAQSSPDFGHNVFRNKHKRGRVGMKPCCTAPTRRCFAIPRFSSSCSASSASSSLASL